MGEIKFRAWDKNSKEIFYVGAISFKNRRVADLGNQANWQTWQSLDNVILMQYTGLKDKNGKEIYEGDIVQPATMNDGNLNLWTMLNGKAVKKKVEIKWNEKYADFEIQLPTSDLEVIGNIYENPELLKERPDEKG